MGEQSSQGLRRERPGRLPRTHRRADELHQSLSDLDGSSTRSARGTALIRDATDALRHAAERRAEWSTNQTLELATALSERSSSRKVEWDYDAGETWARVLDAEGVVALVSAEIPLLIVREHEPEPGQAMGPALSILKVTAVDTPDLSTDPVALFDAFPALEGLMAEDPDSMRPERFSAEDLWLATV